MKKTILIIAILAIVGVIFWMFKSKPNTPEMESITTKTTQNQADDTGISAINKDIDSIDIGSTDQEFKNIDTDLNAL